MHFLLGLGLMAGALASTSLGGWFWAVPVLALLVPVARELITGRGTVNDDGWRDITATWIGSAAAGPLYLVLMWVSVP